MERTLQMISCIHWKRSSLRHCWLTFRQIWTQTLKIGCYKLDAMHCKLYSVSWVFVSNSWEFSMTFIEEHVPIKWEKMLATKNLDWSDTAEHLIGHIVSNTSPHSSFNLRCILEEKQSVAGWDVNAVLFAFFFFCTAQMKFWSCMWDKADEQELNPLVSMAICVLLSNNVPREIHSYFRDLLKSFMPL